MKLRYTLPLLALSISPMAIADVSPALERDFMQTFTQCNGSMFKLIKKHKTELSQYAPIIEKGHIAYFATDDYGWVTFNKPLVINNIELTGYFQYQSELDDMEFSEEDLEQTPIDDLQRQDYHFWGFTTNEPNEKRLARKLSPLNLHRHHSLRYTTHQVIDDVRKSQKWYTKDLGWGKFPKPYSLELTMYIDGDDDPVSLTCTMQGEVTPKILKNIRPDL